jgi:hypothetical protein
MMKTISLKGLKQKCWRLFSELRRRQCADRFGNVTCVSCGKRFHWKEVDAGHFLHGGSGGKGNAVSYDSRNIWPQCRGCNFYGARGEASIRFSKVMYESYGFRILEELMAIKSQSNLRRNDFENMIMSFEERLEKLRKK